MLKDEEKEFSARYEQELSRGPKEWTLDITSRVRGQIETAVASRGGKKVWQFDFKRFRDGTLRQMAVKKA